MVNITLRSVKGSPLTNAEVDSNFNSLNVYKVGLTDSAGSIIVPAGSTAQRDASPESGYLRWNTDTPGLEVYTGSSWAGVGELTTSISYDNGTGVLTLLTSDSSYTTTINLQPFTTTNLVEGTNLYYTTARADSDAKNAVSVTDVGGDGSLTYNPASGVFTYTGPSASEVRAHFSSGTGISYTSGTGVIATNDGQIVHDNLSGFVANEHIDHSTVTITAGSGLTGGGNITSSRTLNIGQGTGITVATDAISTNDAEIVHDNLSGFVANEHIDHSSVTLTAGTGLTGGGNITASRSFAIDSAGLATYFSKAIVHDNTNGFVADEHVAHSGVSIVAGAGLTGGGDITTSRTINVGAGTGVTVNANDIAIGQDVATTANVTFNSVTTTDGLIVGGNLQVNGTTTTVNTQNLSIADNMFYLNQLESDGSPTIIVDVGWAANVNDNGSYTHVGMFRDATDDTFKVFNEYALEPDSALEINTGHASFKLAPFAALNYTGKYLGFDSDFGTKTTDDLTEGSTNLYYDSARTVTVARNSIVAGTGITYTAGTGTIATNDGAIVHDNLSGFVANEHIDHSAVSITAGTGLTGGGNITASRTLSIANTGVGAATYGDSSTIPVITVNAQGQITAVVGAGVNIPPGYGDADVEAYLSGGTGISFSGGVISTNDAQIVHDNLSGFVANEHIDHSAVSITAGSGLTGGGTIAASRTINVGAGSYITVAADAVSVDATTTNTASKVVARDASGNFAAGTITASLSGNATSADSADNATFANNAARWTTARTITLGGDLTGNVSLDGTANVTLTATVAANSVALGTDTTGNYVAAGATSGNGISGSVSSEGGTFTVTSNATNANTGSTIVFRDASGNFSAGTITAALTGNASTATALQTARTIGGVSFNGTANINLPGVNTTGNQNTTGNAASATFASAVTLTADNTTNATNYPLFANAATGNLSPRTDTGLTYNPSTGVLTSTTFSGALSGNASTATALQTARTIGGVSFNGTANINLPGVNTTGNQNTTGSAATLTTSRTLWGQSFNGSANVTGALSSVTTIGMSGQLTSTVSTGTAPFVVASTTVVSNLNADLLDGQHGSYYRIDVYNSAGTLLN